MSLKGEVDRGYCRSFSFYFGVMFSVSENLGRLNALGSGPKVPLRCPVSERKARPFPEHVTDRPGYLRDRNPRGALRRSVLRI